MIKWDNRCIICGQIIPEGLPYCCTCIRRTDKPADNTFGKEKKSLIGKQCSILRSRVEKCLSKIQTLIT